MSSPTACPYFSRIYFAWLNVNGSAWVLRYSWSLTWSAMAYFLSLDKQLTKVTHGYVPRVRGLTYHVSVIVISRSREATKTRKGIRVCGVTCHVSVKILKRGKLSASGSVPLSAPFRSVPRLLVRVLVATQLMHCDALKQDNNSTVRGDGGSRVGEVRAGTTSSMPEHKGFMLQ